MMVSPEVSLSIPVVPFANFHETMALLFRTVPFWLLKTSATIAVKLSVISVPSVLFTVPRYQLTVVGCVPLLEPLIVSWNVSLFAVRATVVLS